MNHFDLWGGPEDAQSHRERDLPMCNFCGETMPDEDEGQSMCAACAAEEDDPHAVAQLAAHIKTGETP